MGRAHPFLLRRAAAQHGRLLSQRVAVSNFDSVFRVVRAGLAISVVPVEVARRYAEVHGLAVMPLTDPWARRRFAVCMRSAAALPAAAELVMAYLVERGARH